MERSELCIPHDLEPHGIGQIALRLTIDELFVDIDRGSFYWSNLLLEQENEAQDGTAS